MSFLIWLLFALNVRKVFAPAKQRPPAWHYLVGFFVLIGVLGIIY